MTSLEVPFSELLQRPTDTVAKLEGSRSRSLRLKRRDAEDLTLTTAARAEQDRAMVSATTKMFVALMRHDDARSLVIDVVPEAFPWVRFLPTEDVRAFVLELVDTLRAAEALENAAPVVQLITEWRHTAEVHADPELAARVRHGDDDHGVVPEPAIHA